MWLAHRKTMQEKKFSAGNGNPKKEPNQNSAFEKLNIKVKIHWISLRTDWECQN